MALNFKDVLEQLEYTYDEDMEKVKHIALGKFHEYCSKIAKLEEELNTEQEKVILLERQVIMLETALENAHVHYERTRY